MLIASSTAVRSAAQENHAVPSQERRRVQPCVDSVFKMQVSFWVNLHLFIRAESRRHAHGMPMEMPLNSLTASEQKLWLSSVESYSHLGDLPLFDKSLIDIANNLALISDSEKLPATVASKDVIQALTNAASIYRRYLWSAVQRQDEEWIVSNCREIQQYDMQAQAQIARLFKVPAPSLPILVDLAPDTGPNLAFTTDGPGGTSGHTILAPQKNATNVVSVDTILHEISHTMVDTSLTEMLDREAIAQHVSIPSDLWHALTLYTTSEITKRLLNNESASALLDNERSSMFIRNGWKQTLEMIENDWQPYLNGKISMDASIQKLVRDTGKR
jgi:hypothetical protein